MSAKLITVGGEQIAPLDASGKPIEEAAYQKLSPDDKLSARERGIRTAAGRKREQDICRAFNVKSLEELKELTHLRAELKARPTPAEISHARHASRGYAALVGAIIGASLAVAGVALHDAGLTTQFATFGHEMAITGAVTQQLNPPQRCVPGEHLADGRVCPQAQQ